MNKINKSNNQQIKQSTKKHWIKLDYLLIGLLLYWIIGLFPPKADAFTMANDNWIIEMGDFVTSGGKPSDKKHQLLSTTGQTAQGVYSGKNYKVKAGFEHIYPLSKYFSFSISHISIDFGLITATNPVSRTSTITLSNPSTRGYQVIAYENGALVNETNIPIHDTTCDNGACTEAISALWTNNLTYGFGYRCDTIEKITCSNAFSQADSYRQFADVSKKESAQVIVSGKGAANNRKAKITYKINISGTQMAGTYGNTITYIAAPTY